ncbi:septum formation family protein [Georgenia wutianyii]|uniref:Septum formation family protein n=1 Tax=Georgenia wutianyii TaxID=2585135 RepID=A0ABX5VQQ6_9MICO|nr:septum formation family protein [Georgenia wutianyii]QDB80383.1 septum formation family protein [Georgenia wutianyii]
MSLRRPVLAAVATLALVGAAGCSANSVLDLTVGDCLNQSDLEGDEVSSVEAVECSEEHDAEIFAEHEFTGDSYPGLTVVQEESEEVCTEKFEEFIGVPYLESELYFTMLYPSEQSWDDADDRTTLCIVLSEEPMTGSLEGAAI